MVSARFKLARELGLGKFDVCFYFDIVLNTRWIARYQCSQLRTLDFLSTNKIHTLSTRARHTSLRTGHTPQHCTALHPNGCTQAPLPCARAASSRHKGGVTTTIALHVNHHDTPVYARPPRYDTRPPVHTTPHRTRRTRNTTPHYTTTYHAPNRALPVAV
jgi:hypothetical protein